MDYLLAWPQKSTQTVDVEIFQIAQFGEYVWGIGDHIICKFNVNTIQYHILSRSRYFRFVSAEIDSGITVILLSVNFIPHKMRSTVHSSFHVIQLHTAISHTTEMELFQVCECSNRLRNHRDLVPCEYQQTHSTAHSSFYVTQLRSAISHTVEIKPSQVCECSNRLRNHCDVVVCESHSI
jgi:hypothetical protein